jgi:heme-degrading monooxygenase HmoA
VCDHGPISVVKINAIEVPPGAGTELEARFAARAGSVDSQPGFEEFMLLRPVAGDDRYFVVTRWESEQAYQDWRNGQAFAHQHRETHTDDGHGEAKPQHPVATGASLLEFEVVSLTVGGTHPAP